MESNTRNILITTPDAGTFTVGERVVVATRTQMGLMAAALCYAMPAVVLVAVIAAVVLCGYSEGIAALASLGSVAAYYGILWMFRDKLAQKISFTIHKE